MAIDPSIALAFRSPEITAQPVGPLQLTGQVLSLRDLMQQGQLRDIQIQQQLLNMQRAQELAQYFGTLGQTPAPAAAARPLTIPAPPAITAAPTAAAPAVPDIVPGGLAGALPGLNTISGAGSTGVPPGTTWTTPAAASATAAPITAPTAAAPAAAQPPLTVPLTGEAYGGFPNIDRGKILQIDPINGPAIIKNIDEMEKSYQETQGKRLENNAKKMGRFAALGQSVLDAPDPAAAYPGAIMQAHAEALIDTPTAQQWLAHGFDRNAIQQFVSSANDVKTQHEIPGTDLDNFKKALTNASQSIQSVNDQGGYSQWLREQPLAIQRRYGTVYSPDLKSSIIRGGISAEQVPTFAKGTQEALQAGLETFAQGIGRITSLPPQQQAAAWANALSQAPADVQRYYAGMSWDPAATPALVSVAGVKPAAGTTFPKPPAVEAQEIRVATQKEYARIAAEAGVYAPAVSSVLSGKTRFQDLPQETQTKIAPYLLGAGYTQIGKDLSDAERQRLTDLNTSVAEADRLYGIVTDKTNKLLTGPLNRGPADWGLIPGYSSAVQKLDADFAGAQQKLKSFISNKSLRGLSNEQLERITPDVNDWYGVNEYKARQLRDRVTAERDQFVKDLAGKVIPPGVTTGVPGRPSAPAAAPSAVPKPGDIRPGSGGKKWMFIGGNPNDKNAWTEYHEQ